MDSDTIYEEETVEMNNESDAKDQNTDSESEMNEVIVGEEEVIEQHLDEVVIYDHAPSMSGRKQDLGSGQSSRKPQQVVKRDGVVNVRQQQSSGIISQQRLQQRPGQQQITPKPMVKLMPGQKVFPMAKPVKLSGFGASQILSPGGSSPVKRKADGSPMVVKLDQFKKARPAESLIGARPTATPQSKVRIVRHSHMQTDVSGDIIDQYQQIIDEDQQKIAQLEDQVRKLKYSPEMFENDDKRTEYFTGMDSFVTMITLYNTCEESLPASSQLTKFEIYILTLLRLRLKLPLPFLAYMFGVSPKAANFFYDQCLTVLHGSLREVFADTLEVSDGK